MQGVLADGNQYHTSASYQMQPNQAMWDAPAPSNTMTDNAVQVPSQQLVEQPSSDTT